MTFPISIEEYLELDATNCGLCTACGAERECCEPDADGYDCPECGENAVQGSLNLLTLGLVE